MEAKASEPAVRGRAPRTFVGACWLLALGLNVATVLLRPGDSPDTARYQRIAANLLAGHGYSSSPAAPYKPEILRPPVYPVFLAAASLLGTDAGLAARLLQALLLALLVPLGYLIAREALGERVGLVTALLTACYPYYWIYSASLLSEAPAVFLMALAAWLLTWSLRRQQAAAGLPVGLTLGLLSLAKPVALLLPLWAFAVYRVRLPRPGPAWARTAWCLAGCALVVLPWTVRNELAVGRLLPVAAGGGLQLYASAASSVHGYSAQKYFDEVLGPGSRVLQAQFSDDPAVTLALDDELGREALALYAAHPWAFALHLPVTMVRVWLSVNTWGAEGAHVSWPHLLLTAGLLVVAIVGMVLRRRELSQAAVPFGAVIAFAVLHAPFCPEARQTLPARLFLLMFVAAALVAVAGRRRR